MVLMGLVVGVVQTAQACGRDHCGGGGVHGRCCGRGCWLMLLAMVVIDLILMGTGEIVVNMVVVVVMWSISMLWWWWWW